MTGVPRKVRDAGIQPVPTVTDSAVAAVKWRQRAEQVEIAKRRRAVRLPTHMAASIPQAEVGRENPQGAFYTVDEVAGRLNVCSKTIRNWIRDGRLPAHRPGKKLIISKNDLDNFVAGSRTPQR